MQAMYEQYNDIAEFRIVYINEAHPADGGNPTSYAKEKDLKRHTSYEDRCVTAEMLVRDKHLTIPCLIDGMDNAADLAYSAWPDKVFLVRKDGRLAVAGEDGPLGFVPAMQEAEAWLKEYRETGKEPAIAAPRSADFRIAVAGENRPDGPQESFLSDSRMPSEKTKPQSTVAKRMPLTSAEMNRYLTLAQSSDLTVEQLEAMAQLRERCNNIESALSQAVISSEHQLRQLQRELRRSEAADKDVDQLRKSIAATKSAIELDKQNLDLFNDLPDENRQRAKLSAEQLRALAEETKSQQDDQSAS